MHLHHGLGEPVQRDDGQQRLPQHKRHLLLFAVHAAVCHVPVLERERRELHGAVQLTAAAELVARPRVAVGAVPDAQAIARVRTIVSKRAQHRSDANAAEQGPSRVTDYDY